MDQPTQNPGSQNPNQPNNEKDLNFLPGQAPKKKRSLLDMILGRTPQQTGEQSIPIDPETGVIKHGKIENDFKRMKFLEKHGYGFQRAVLIAIGIVFFVIVFYVGYVVIKAVLPEPDGDNDGVSDVLDQCPGEDDAVDIDQDGIIDGCDSAVAPADLRDISASEPQLLEVSERNYDVLFDIVDENSEWGLSNLRYRIDLLDAAGNVLKSKSGTTFVNPGATKKVIETSVTTSEKAASAKVELLSGDFYQALTTETIGLEVRERKFTPRNSDGIATLSAVLQNESNFDLDAVEVQMLVKDSSGTVISTNFTVVKTLTTDDSRFFELRFNRSFTDDVTYDILTSTNAMEEKNLIRKQGGQVEF